MAAGKRHPLSHGGATMATSEVRERIAACGPGHVSDSELLTILGAEDAAGCDVHELAWLSLGELRQRGLSEVRAVALAAAFELGRRGAWSIATARRAVPRSRARVRVSPLTRKRLILDGLVTGS
jgi:DNA repair protein RadC